MGAVHEGGRQRKQSDILRQEGQKITTKMSKSNMERLSMLSIILLVLLIQAEGGTIKMKSKSSKGKETVAPHIVRNPGDTSVVRGERVFLDCEAAPRSSVKSCSWTKSGSELSLDSRHWLEGCSLVIDPVQGSDEGSYVCLVKTSTSQMESRPASLEVLVEPGVPSILEAREGDWVEVDQGEELLLTCESQGGRPHAELQWRDAEGQRVFGHVQEHITRIGTSPTFKTVSTLRFNPLQPMVVTCTAHSEAFTKVASSRPLTVQLRRKVEEEEVKVRIGANTELSCSHQGGIFKWTLNSKEIEGESGNILSIEDFTADFDNSVVRCLQEKMNGETRILRQFKLMQEGVEGEDKGRKPARLEQAREVGLQYDQPVQVVPEQPAESRNIFTCSGEEEEGSSGDAEYVWVNGRLEKKVKMAKSKKEGKEIKCKLVPGGLRKVKAMEKKLKAISKDLKRFSRILGQFSSPLGGR